MNKNHEILIEQLKENPDLLEEFKLFFYNNKRSGLMEKYNITQKGASIILKYFNIKVPKELRNIRRKKTCINKYGAPTIFQTDFFWDKARAESLKNYGVEYPNQNKEQYQHSLDTKEKLYGNAKYNNSEKQKETVKNKSEDDKLKIKLKKKITCIEKYGGPAPACNKKVMDKMVKSRCEAHSWGTSKPEKIYYEYLKNKYGEEDIIHPYYDIRYSREDGYQYECDFYIKSLDMFIELNIFPTHGKEPFNPDNPEHLKILNEAKTNPKNWVDNGLLKDWAKSDLEKIQCAKKNNLNYKTIYADEWYSTYK